jgi:hypothetical protein
LAINLVVPLFFLSQPETLGPVDRYILAAAVIFALHRRFARVWLPSAPASLSPLPCPPRMFPIDSDHPIQIKTESHSEQ